MSQGFVERLRQQHGTPATEAGARWQLQYVLSLDASGWPRLEFRVGRVEPNGRLAGAQPYRLQRGHLARAPSFLQATDSAFLADLARVEPDWLQAHAGPWPESLDIDWLHRLVATERVRDPTDRPIRPGATLAGECAWSIDHAGHQHLCWCTGPDTAVLATAPPCWLDRATGQLGHLESALPAQAQASIARGWSLAPSEVADCLSRYGQWLDRHALPRPIELPKREVERAPSGRIRLFSLEDEAPPGRDRLRLEYRYDDGDLGTVFGPDDDETRRTRYDPGRETCVTFVRAPAAEVAWADSLHETVAAWRASASGDGDITLADADCWQAFMIEGVPRLQRQGWQIEIDPAFRHRYVRPDSWRVEAQWLERDWFELRLDVDVEGERVPLLPLLTLCARQYSRAGLAAHAPATELPLTLMDGRRLLLPVGRLVHWLDILAELDDVALDTECLHLPAAQRHRLAQLDDGETTFAGEPTLLDGAHAERRPAALTDFRAPAAFAGRLRDYQRLGVAWLQQRQRLGTGGILADDMGLGKTLQILAHVALEREQGRLTRPALVVAPTSVLANWRDAARDFCPSLDVCVLHGPGRHSAWEGWASHDLVLTSYGLVMRDAERWREHELAMVVLDEAQAIRNPGSVIARHVRELHAPVRFCLTGTPMQNHLGELWSLFDFLQPGALGSERSFRRHYRRPIEDDGDHDRARALMDRIAPFVLRRTKDEVASELPQKNESTLRIPLPDDQRDLYEMLRSRGMAELQAQREAGDGRQDPVRVLNALLQLRQACCDPRLTDAAHAHATGSGKRDYLLYMLRELVAEDRRILVFSQFTRMLDLIAADLQSAGIEYVTLTGRTGDRARPVERFQQGSVPVFLISLKAGGTGLNLTRADTVIHYDPWWNAAAEDQATDRAHRIGQQRPVFVYRLLAQETVEEKVHALQQHKRDLTERICEAAETHSARLARDHATLMSLMED